MRELDRPDLENIMEASTESNVVRMSLNAVEECYTNYFHTPLQRHFTKLRHSFDLMTIGDDANGLASAVDSTEFPPLGRTVHVTTPPTGQ